MRIALIGTRGVPARYGGFETAVEEIGRRLVANGHQVIVFCRGVEGERLQSYQGMELVHLPAVPKKSVETLSHTALSMAHLALSRLVRRRRVDAAIVFNAANAPLLPLLRLQGIPVAVHVDGLEWKRAKWGPIGQRYYKIAERLAVWWADSLIADAQGIADHYRTKFQVPTTLLTYGAPILTDAGSDRLQSLDLSPQGYHLVVARFEPENHVLEIVKGYAASPARLPLVVVGSAPYADRYTVQIQDAAGSDPRIRMLGGVWDQKQLDQLYANAFSYLHGHSVGGTNPSLLRAMGAGTAVIGFDVSFNREVLGNIGGFFTDPDDLAALVEQAERHPEVVRSQAQAVQQRARSVYRWDDVAVGYEALLHRLHREHGKRPSSAPPRRLRAVRPVPSSNGTRRGES